MKRWTEVVVVGLIVGLGIVVGSLSNAHPVHAANACPPGTIPVEVWDGVKQVMKVICEAPGVTRTPIPTGTPTRSTSDGTPTPRPTSTGESTPPAANSTVSPTPDPQPTLLPGTPLFGLPAGLPSSWQWLGCTSSVTCPVNQAHSCWGMPGGRPLFCSSRCDCQVGPARVPTPIGEPPPHGGSLPDPQPPGFNGFWKQVQAQVGTPIVKYHPYPSGLVNTQTSFWVDNTTPLYAPSAAGSTLTISAWANPQGDPSVTWRNYRLSLRWRLRTDDPFIWNFADSSPNVVGGFGQAGAVHHVYQQSSYGQPQNGPHDPNTARTYPNQTPAFPVTVTTFWTAEWQVAYDQDRVVDDSHCVSPGDPSATDHSATCPGAGLNHHSGTRHVITHVGPTPWQEIDLRQLGNPTSDDAQTTTLPTSIVQLQSILTH